jgi:FKBP-type peptidyl-prolyl cis-trans isomerase SlpA
VFKIDAEDAFGEHNPRLVERISRSALPPELELKENSLVEFAAPAGTMPEIPGMEGSGAGIAGYLRELTDTTALFDFNHPLAGKPIRFEVEIIGIM